MTLIELVKLTTLWTTGPWFKRIFSVHILGSQECKVLPCGQWRIWSDCVNAQADLSPARMHRLIWVFVGRTCPKARFLTLRLKSIATNNQGPVVQSVVSLTSTLRVISLTVLADSIHNVLIFFAEKMWVAFALLTFFQQKISAYSRIIRCKF